MALLVQRIPDQHPKIDNRRLPIRRTCDVPLAVIASIERQPAGMIKLLGPVPAAQFVILPSRRRIQGMNPVLTTPDEVNR